MGFFKKSKAQEVREESYSERNGEFGAPPPEPPPGYSLEAQEDPTPRFQPPSYPPPSGSHFDPLYSNANDDERDIGENFCSQYSLFPPLNMSDSGMQEASQGRFTLVPPPPMNVPTNSKLTTWKRFKGEFQNARKDNTVFIRSKKDTKDCLFVSDKPLYAPRSLRNAKIYYEITITSLPHPEEASIALGFTCLPYPPFRLPGWHRGSLAVHSDDGRRYVNDSLSGKDFVRPFQTGETIGLGIDYARRAVFFTRNGVYESEWSLVQDSQTTGVDPYRGYRDGGVDGLNGECDVFAAVGVYGAVGVIVKFTDFKFTGL